MTSSATKLSNAQLIKKWGHDGFGISFLWFEWKLRWCFLTKMYEVFRLLTQEAAKKKNLINELFCVLFLNCSCTFKRQCHCVYGVVNVKTGVFALQGCASRTFTPGFKRTVDGDKENYLINLFCIWSQRYVLFFCYVTKNARDFVHLHALWEAWCNRSLGWNSLLLSARFWNSCSANILRAMDYCQEMLRNALLLRCGYAADAQFRTLHSFPGFARWSTYACMNWQVAFFPTPWDIPLFLTFGSRLFLCFVQTSLVCCSVF